MKITKFLLATACSFALLAGSTTLAADKLSECCAKAKAAGKDCDSKCCVEAKKMSKDCEVCKKAAKKKD